MLLHPSANRVYADASMRLSERELQVFAGALGAQPGGARISDVATREIAGVPYLTFEAPGLGERDLALLANLSCRYALFECRGELLRPLACLPRDRFGSDLLTILKYRGKTNEHFTKLLLNVTVLATDDPLALIGGTLRVLDPLCGRGTTLNQALAYGFDAVGIDIDRRDFDEYVKFLKTWLRNNRLKHTADVTSVRRNKVTLGRRLDARVGATREEYKAGNVIEIGFVNADTCRAAEFLRPRSFDVIVTDAPYGVQHGSRGGGDQARADLARDPRRLLASALPVWQPLLRPGGAIGIAFNTRVAPRAAMVELLAANGFEPADLGGAFTHRVDQAIVRDLVVARKRG